MIEEPPTRPARNLCTKPPRILRSPFLLSPAPAAGFIPYASVRDLDVLTLNAAFPPD